MISALGYSIDTFNPTHPGRLCRGREQWIDSLDPEVSPLGRLVVSGSKFSDETARDAIRGLEYSGASLGEAFRAVFPTSSVFAACEDGHPRLVPEDAVQVEEYALARPTGRLREWAVRWVMPCAEPETIDEAVVAGADMLLVLTDPPSDGELPEALREAVFRVHGYRSAGPPARRFQPGALSDLLTQVRAVGLIHLDKHGPSLGIYGEPPEGAGPALSALAQSKGSLPVPFAIPPMLARWDRALFELRADWDEAELGEFPVPPADDGVVSWGRQPEEE